MKSVLRWCVVPLLSTLLVAQNSTPEAANPSPTDNQTLTVQDVKALREALAAQQKQLQEQQRKLDALEHALQQPKPQPQAPNVGQVASTTPMVPKAPASTHEVSAAIAASQYSQQPETQKPSPSPLSFRIGNTDFTPGGFADFTSFFRTTNVGSGIGTSFGSIPFSNTVQGHLSEFRFSAQNSRLALKVNGKYGDNDVTGYVEADFLGVQPANPYVTSNANTFRMRLYWVDLKRDKWEILGGQSWSMLTPNRKSISPVPSDIFYTQDMDTNYQVGLTWTRAAQFRLIYHPNEHWALGFGLENPEQYIGTAVTLPSSLSSFYATQLDNNALTSTPNVAPDVIPKIAYDTDLSGKHFHVEAVGVARWFKTFNPSATSTSKSITGGTSDVVMGAGGSFNANLELFKNFHLIATSFYSDGGGRYIFGLAPDLVVNPNGSLVPLHSGSGIGGFEYQVTKKTLIYGYYGGVYIQRRFFTDPKTGKPVGYGEPGSKANRDVQEGTFGIIQTLWKNERYGALQLITQASYLERSPWSFSTGAPKNAHLGMGYVNLRYVLP